VESHYAQQFSGLHIAFLCHVSGITFSLLVLMC